jgi:hypothetical protein
MENTLSRRAMIMKIVRISVGAALVVALSDAAGAEKVCADPKAMDNSQQGLRMSLNYTETSSDPSKTCSVCAFFQPNPDGCGTCMIFSGPANAKGHCDSWAAKS